MIRHALRSLRSTARALRNGLDLLSLVSIDGYNSLRNPVHFANLDAALDAFEAGDLHVDRHPATGVMPLTIRTPSGGHHLWHIEVQGLARRRRGAL